MELRATIELLMGYRLPAGWHAPVGAEIDSPHRLLDGASAFNYFRCVSASFADRHSTSSMRTGPRGLAVSACWTAIGAPVTVVSRSELFGLSVITSAAERAEKEVPPAPRSRPARAAPRDDWRLPASRLRR